MYTNQTGEALYTAVCSTMMVLYLLHDPITYALFCIFNLIQKNKEVL